MTRQRLRSGRPGSAVRWSVAMDTVLTLLILAVPLLPTRASAVDYRWANPVSGAWGTSSNWQPVGVPISTADSAYVALSGTAFDIDLNLSPTLRGCLLANPSTVLRLNGNIFATAGALTNHAVILANAGFTSGLWGTLNNAASGLVRIPGSAVLLMNGVQWRNDGIIRLHEGEPQTAYLRPAANLTLMGTGALVLQDSTRALLDSPSGWGLTNAAGHTIRGAGSLSAPLTNHGLVEADQDGSWLLLSYYNKSNDGTLRATGGGKLRLEACTLTNTNGSVLAESGPVILKDLTIAGGTLGSGAGQTITVLGTVNMWDLRNTGRLEVRTGAVSQLAGTSLVNDGTLVVHTGGGGAAILRMAGNVTVNGSGSIELAQATSALLDSPSGWGLTNAAGHTLCGAGMVSAPLGNLGTVRADRDAEVLRLNNGPKTNSGLFGATAGGILRLEVAPTNYNATMRRLTGGRWEVAAGSAIQLIGCPIDSIGADIVLEGPESRLLKDDAGGDALAGLVRIASDGSFTVRHGRNFTTAGDLSNGGRLLVGAGSVVSVAGPAFRQHPGACYRVEIGGREPDRHGLLHASGEVQLAGGFEVSLVDDFLPALGDTFEVMRFAAVSGEFDPNLPFNLGNGLYLTSEWRPQSLLLRVVGPAGVGDGPREQAPAQLPGEFRLTARRNAGEFPLLQLALPVTADIHIDIFDVSGRRVTTLLQASESAGIHEYTWDGRGDHGERSASGLYIARARLDAPGGPLRLSVKFVLVR